MTHVRFDRFFPRHRKIHGLSHLAFRIWVTAIAHAREQGVDGRLTHRDLDMLPSCERGRRRADAVSELEQAGLWEPVDGGWFIHDFLDWQDTAEAVRARQARARERMRHVRANRPRTFENGSHEVSDGPFFSISDLKSSSGSGSSDLTSSSDLTGSAREGETPAKTPKKRARPAPKLALPEDWKPVDSHREKARKLGLACDAQAEKFRNSARAHGRVYADWNAAFHTWLDNAPGFAGRSQPAAAPGLIDHEARVEHEREEHRRWLLGAARDGQFGEKAKAQAVAGTIDIAKLESHYERTKKVNGIGAGGSEPAQLGTLFDAKLPPAAEPAGKAQAR